MSEFFVVPDSIEPWIGWKALTLREDGYMSSPSYSSMWPVKERFTAHCAHIHGWKWEAVEVDGPLGGWIHHPQPADEVIPDKPSLVLPRGLAWAYMPQYHEAPAAWCSCGIYAVLDPKNCKNYMQVDRVLVKLAMWGHVVVADDGARGQYAYPQEIHTAAHLADVCELIAPFYGVPLLVESPEIKNLGKRWRPRGLGVTTCFTVEGKTAQLDINKITKYETRADAKKKKTGAFRRGGPVDRTVGAFLGVGGFAGLVWIIGWAPDSDEVSGWGEFGIMLLLLALVVSVAVGFVTMVRGRP